MFEAGSVDPDAVSIVGVDDGHLFPGEERGIWVGVRVPFVFGGRNLFFCPGFRCERPNAAGRSGRGSGFRNPLRDWGLAGP